MSTSQPLAADHARLAALYEVSQALGSSLKADEALTIAMDSAIQLTGAERGFLMLLDEDLGQFVFRLARNAKRETVEEKLFEISRSVVRLVAESLAPVVTTNAQLDPRFADKESIVQFSLRSIMAVPLLVRDKLTGVLYVDNKARDGMFDQGDLDLLNSFAGQAAVAIENARLYTQTDEALAARVADLQTMQIIDRQLNTALDFEKVLSVTLEWAIKRTRAETGWIGLVGPEDVWVAVGRGKGEALPRDHPLVKAALTAGKTQPLTNPMGNSAVVDGPVVSGLEADPLVHLVAPVRREGKVIAILAVERSGATFVRQDREFLARLADHAAIAIENARLYDVVKRANDTKSKFVSIVSHELRLPMTSIKGYTDLLRQAVVGPVNEQQLQF
ncbi:MAG: GAF domain-containing protein, partial [Anaerolineales bacterium]